MGQLGPIRGGASLPFLLEEKKGRGGRHGPLGPCMAGHLPSHGFSTTCLREESWHTPSYYKRGGGVHLFTHN